MTDCSYSVVIATKGRSQCLLDTVSDLQAQSKKAAKIIISDSSADPSGNPADHNESLKDVDIDYRSSDLESAAKQRNYGAELVDTPLICFLDDDVRLPEDHFERLLNSWRVGEDIVGMSGRIKGLSHSPPKGVLRAYYRFQAGYDHSDYGGQVFGPAINTVPTYFEEDRLIPSEWLNSTCLLLKTDVFSAELFPDFQGYSWGEDMHLSTRIRKHGCIYFENTSPYVHVSPQDSGKRDFYKMALMQFVNQYRVSTECLGRGPAWTRRRLCIHLYFLVMNMIRTGNKNWRSFLAGGRRALGEVSK
ncbi:MAG: glycosyltransferase family 2 protein [Opitutales bacterium]